jgi:hypothetical protein
MTPTAPANCIQLWYQIAANAYYAMVATTTPGTVTILQWNGAAWLPVVTP